MGVSCPSVRISVRWEDWWVAHLVWPLLVLLAASGVSLIVQHLFERAYQGRPIFRKFVKLYLGKGKANHEVPHPEYIVGVHVASMVSSGISVVVWCLHTYWRATTSATRGWMMAMGLVDLLSWQVNRLKGECTLRSLWEVDSVVDMLTIVPRMRCGQSPEACSAGEDWLTLHFLRSYAVLFSFEEIQKTGVTRHYARQVQMLLRVVFQVTCLLLIMSGFIFTAEVLGDPFFLQDSCVETSFGDRISLFQTVYYVIVSITTVGYGDFAPRTSLSRLVVSCFIVIGISTIYKIQFQFGLLWSSYKEGAGCFRSKRGELHVVILLAVRGRPARLSSLLTGFLHEILHASHRQTPPTLSEVGMEKMGIPWRKPVTRKLVETVDWPTVVVFAPALWDGNGGTFEDFVGSLGLTSLARRRVHYIVGSATSKEDLDRASVGSSSLTFVVGDCSSDAPEEDDAQTVFTALTLWKLFPGVRLRLMLDRPESKNLAVQSGIDFTRCFSARELKANILAQNVRCHGMIPMIIGLFKSGDEDDMDAFLQNASKSIRRRTTRIQLLRSRSSTCAKMGDPLHQSTSQPSTGMNDSRDWVLSYFQGLQRRIYGFELASEFHGKSFGSMVSSVYRRTGAIVVGIYDGGRLAICPQFTHKRPLYKGQICFAVAPTADALDPCRIPGHSMSDWRKALYKVREQRSQRVRNEGVHVEVARLMRHQIRPRVMIHERADDISSSSPPDRSLRSSWWSRSQGQSQPSSLVPSPVPSPSPSLQPGTGKGLISVLPMLGVSSTSSYVGRNVSNPMAGLQVVGVPCATEGAGDVASQSEVATTAAVSSTGNTSPIEVTVTQPLLGDDSSARVVGPLVPSTGGSPPLDVAIISPVFDGTVLGVVATMSSASESQPVKANAGVTTSTDGTVAVPSDSVQQVSETRVLPSEASPLLQSESLGPLAPIEVSDGAAAHGVMAAASSCHEAAPKAIEGSQALLRVEASPASLPLLGVATRAAEVSGVSLQALSSPLPLLGEATAVAEASGASPKAATASLSLSVAARGAEELGAASIAEAGSQPLLSPATAAADASFVRMISTSSSMTLPGVTSAVTDGSNGAPVSSAAADVHRNLPLPAPLKPCSNGNSQRSHSSIVMAGEVAMSGGTKRPSCCQNTSIDERRDSVFVSEGTVIDQSQKLREWRMQSKTKEFVILLVCNGDVWQQVRTFVGCLRESYLPEKIPLVILAPVSPKSGEFDEDDELSLFIEGSCLSAQQLFEAGVAEASNVVVMSGEPQEDSWLHGPHFRDYRTILCAQELECWCGFLSKEVFTIYELQDSRSVCYLPVLRNTPVCTMEQLFGDDDEEHVGRVSLFDDDSDDPVPVEPTVGNGDTRQSSVLLHPRFAAGQVFATELWGSMLGHMFYMPALIELIEALVMPSLRGQSAFPWQIRPPEKYVGGEFRNLFLDFALGKWSSHMIDTENSSHQSSADASEYESPSIAMAIYRSRKDVGPRSPAAGMHIAQGTGAHHFNILAPAPGLIVDEDDWILVLGSKCFGRCAYDSGLLRGTSNRRADNSEGREVKEWHRSGSNEPVEEEEPG
eukprot:TRINITY_DN28725_c0_g1_i1.p1 TRINITY_DN28725_c0_g1~~TRINITY_DN28725_c0_g1_i1.p1  ORF type:complete len:1568 (-),score=254.04 TRINITY_DN28725_c0_g1_i1:14-4717(-)